VHADHRSFGVMLESKRRTVDGRTAQVMRLGPRRGPPAIFSASPDGVRFAPKPRNRLLCHFAVDPSPTIAKVLIACDHIYRHLPRAKKKKGEPPQLEPSASFDRSHQKWRAFVSAKSAADTCRRKLHCALTQPGNGAAPIFENGAPPTKKKSRIAVKP